MSLGARLARCAAAEANDDGTASTVGGVTIRQRSPEQQRKHEQLLGEVQRHKDRAEEVQAHFRDREGAGRINWVMLTPFGAMPVLMMTRLIKDAAVRDRSFKGVLAVSVVHSLACVCGFYDGVS